MESEKPPKFKFNLKISVIWLALKAVINLLINKQSK